MSMTTEVKGTNGTAIQRQEWIVRYCEKESELKDNYNNELRLKLSKKALIRKQGDALYGIIHGQLGSNVVTAAQNSTNPSYVDTHRDYCVLSLMNICPSVSMRQEYIQDQGGSPI